MIELVTDAKLIPTGRGQFALAGHVRATVAHVDNATLPDPLGGTAVVAGDLSRKPSGVLAIDRVKLTGPKFKGLDGHGA